MKTLIAASLIFLSLSISAQVANFELVNAMNGQNVSLDDYQSSTAVVIIFMSTTCPYDAYYYGRIAKYVLAFQGKLNVLLVNPNVNETPASMKTKANEIGISIPYLIDKDQTLMKSLGATKTPEVFVLKNNGGVFSMFYHGAIDDNAQVETDVSASYLVNATSSLLVGKPWELPEIRPVGCTIRKK